MIELISEPKPVHFTLKSSSDHDVKWATSDQANQNWIRAVYNSLKK